MKGCPVGPVRSAAGIPCRSEFAEKTKRRWERGVRVCVFEKKQRLTLLGLTGLQLNAHDPKLMCLDF